MLGSVHGKIRTERAREVPLEKFARRNMVRNVLKDGLALERETGTNPFVMGFIGSTDTHSASPGAAEEDNYATAYLKHGESRKKLPRAFTQGGSCQQLPTFEYNDRAARYSASKDKLPTE